MALIPLFARRFVRILVPAGPNPDLLSGPTAAGCKHVAKTSRRLDGDRGRGRIEAPGEEIAEHDRRYHTEDAPVVTDAEYDALARRKPGDRSAVPGVDPRRFAVAAGRRAARGRLHQGAPRRADAQPRQGLHRSGRRRFHRARVAASSIATRTWRSRSPPSRRSTGCLPPCAMRAECRAGCDARRRRRRRGYHREPQDDR